MNKRNLKVLAMLIFGITGAKATINDFRTPVPLDRAYAYSHYPFARPDYDDCKCWFIDVWGAGLHKTANRAFLNKDTTKKESLSGIFFGLDSFTAAQAFVPGSVSAVNPLLNVLLITPNFDYRENTAFFGANIETVFGCENQWHVGFRARVPFRDIKVALDSCCELEENATDLYVIDNERWSCPLCDTPIPVGQEQTVNDVFAIRLDFASALFQQQSGSAPFIPTPLVQYGNGSTNPPPIGNTRIAGVDVTNILPALTPIYLIESDGGAQPTPPFALRQEPDVAGLPVLPASGAGSGTGSKFVFGTLTNYATGIGMNSAAQKNFWVAPAINNTIGDIEINLVDDAVEIRTTLNDLLQFHQINNKTPVDFLLSQGITFDTQRNNGIGDFDTEFYGRYDGCTCCLGSWFAEGIFGVRFPTSKRINNPGKLLKVQTGNNHHYEIKLGGFLGWNPVEWFAVKADAWYHWALSSKQRVAAPFKGAMVKNIGPTIDAKVSWQYFVGDVDFTFIIPCIEPLIGFDVGYQAWVKQRDHVKLGVTSATDFFGIVQPLDPTILQARTKRISHTVKVEIFKQTCDWQIFGGWNHTFAGKNSLNDTDWYLGLEVYF